MSDHCKICQYRFKDNDRKIVAIWIEEKREYLHIEYGMCPECPENNQPTVIEAWFKPENEFEGLHTWQEYRTRCILRREKRKPKRTKRVGQNVPKQRTKKGK